MCSVCCVSSTWSLMDSTPGCTLVFCGASSESEASSILICPHVSSSLLAVSRSPPNGDCNGIRFGCYLLEDPCTLLCITYVGSQLPYLSTDEFPSVTFSTLRFACDSSRRLCCLLFNLSSADIILVLNLFGGSSFKRLAISLLARVIGWLSLLSTTLRADVGQSVA